MRISAIVERVIYLCYVLFMKGRDILHLYASLPIYVVVLVARVLFQSTNTSGRLTGKLGAEGGTTNFPLKMVKPVNNCTILTMPQITPPADIKESGCSSLHDSCEKCNADLTSEDPSERLLGWFHSGGSVSF